VEMDAARASGLFEAILWIDRDVPVDPTVTFDRSDCTDHLRNDGTLEDFKLNLKLWARMKGFLE